MQIDQEQLKKIILDSKLVSHDDLDEAIKKAKEKKQKFGVKWPKMDLFSVKWF